MFDPSRRAERDTLKSALKRLAVHLEREEMNLGLRNRARKEKDQRKFRLAVEVIGCNLLMAKWLANDAKDNPGPPVELYRSLSIIRKADPSRPEVYGQAFLDALDLMSHPKIGLASQTQGHRIEGRAGQPSTISPRPALWDHLPLDDFHPRDLRREIEEGLIILNAPKSRSKRGVSRDAPERLPLPDIRRIKPMRNAIKRLNDNLRRADIALVEAEGGGPRFGMDRDGRPLDPTQRLLKRHFNNGSLEQGGRLFGGFWQHLGRADRLQRLRIDGERVADVDYGQLYLRLCYVVEGASQPAGDLYAIDGLEGHREGIKKLVNAMLFAEKPLTRWPRDTASLFPEGTKVADVRERVLARHPAIAHRFGTGFGFRLMLIESEMLIDLLRALFNIGITALPIHDAVMVAVPHAETAKEAMLETFSHFDGFRDADPDISRGLVKIEYPADYCGFEAL
ncbi:hypothetical protein GR183_17485 [Stappia sp. GBMRC 2046]|uniref:Uncharacterized protein n=1 Tax=Stappia sediminis TaxID=2692190 RepID=A0A7X3LX35_9HYPH|nr:hypothetical protein [Stappia sediminis]MXN66710.1 hypothetical protein [Stappia sediminis]